MKRFILKCILMIVLVAGILFLASFAYVHSAAYVNMERLDGTDTYAAMPEQIDVAVFGASHGMYAFRIAPEGRTFFNFSLSGQTPAYDLRLMREYQDRIQPGALVVLTMSYPSLFMQMHDSSFAEKQPRYYRILSPENIIDLDTTRYYLSRYCPILNETLTSLIASFANLVLDDTAFDALDDHAVLSRDDIPAMQMHMRNAQWDEIIAAALDTSPPMEDTYRQILTLCREHGWTTVLVTPPYLEEYNDCFPEGFFPVFYDTVSDLSQEFDVPYLDYSHDETYFGRYELYRDIDHMNLPGAEMFDAQFYADLAQQGIWPR